MFFVRLRKFKNINIFVECFRKKVYENNMKNTPIIQYIFCGLVMVFLSACDKDPSKPSYLKLGCL